MRIINSHARAAIDTNTTGIATGGVAVDAGIIDSHARAVTAGDNATAVATGAVTINAGVIDSHIAAGDADRAAAGTGAVVGDARTRDGYIATGDINCATAGTGGVTVEDGIGDGHGGVAGDTDCATGHTGISIATSTDVIICTCAFGTYIDRRRRTASIYSPLVFHFIRLIKSLYLTKIVWHQYTLYCACR